jgi:hypothetical protein
MDDLFKKHATGGLDRAATKAQTSIVAGSSDKAAALKRISRAVASSGGLGEDSDRVVVAALERAAVHIEAHVALQRGR